MVSSLSEPNINAMTTTTRIRPTTTQLAACLGVQPAYLESVARDRRAFAGDRLDEAVAHCRLVVHEGTAASPAFAQRGIPDATHLHARPAQPIRRADAATLRRSQRLALGSARPPRDRF